MDKRFIPVAMLAGALALAGCGGGSSTTAAGTGDAMTCDDDEMLVGGECVAKMADEDEDDETETFEALRVTGADLSSAEDRAGGNNGQISGAGTLTQRTRQVGNLAVTCPVGPQCRWRIVDGELEVTNGATGQLWTVFQDSLSPKATASVEDGHWLSDASLIEGVGRVRQGSGEEVVLIKGGVPIGVSPSVFTPTADDDSDGVIPIGTPGTWGDVEENDVRERGNRLTDLRMSHTRTVTGEPGSDNALARDYMVFGAWEERTVDAENYPGDPKRGVLWAGSEAYGERPHTSIDAATYRGGALGFHKAGSGDWAEWEGGIVLRANFPAQLIDGRVTTAQTGTSAFPTGTGAVTHINIPETNINSHRIGSTGLTVAGVSGTSSTGSWNAEFFGYPDADGPSGIAGDFKATRPTQDVGDTSIPGYAIEGAFGAEVVQRGSN